MPPFSGILGHDKGQGYLFAWIFCCQKKCYGSTRTMSICSHFDSLISLLLPKFTTLPMNYIGV